MLYGVDISEHNGYVNFDELKKADMSFVIIRSSYGMLEDSLFRYNVDMATKAGLTCGAYHYSYATNSDDAQKESEFVCKLIKESGCFLGLPIFLDMEDADNYKRDRKVTNEQINNICKIFISNVKNMYNCGLYSSLDWLTYLIDWKSLDCCVWSAQWNTIDDFKGYMWQYTDKLNINGKVFDGDVLYQQGVDY